ncbi:hypothetical protein JOF41_007332 [Saccharothrix coeruleofusca]|uniref:hypothetical protein n=1 Tax=Saccharothrix coeruleofusca TaxID=33919 RepID=UPI001AEAFB09|nr:hypothetical protein [Saccharothrix coeruleofusca]MBP2341078.1 hypothetical protein [Saccharothrix coeruleofusca]
MTAPALQKPWEPIRNPDQLDHTGKVFVEAGAPGAVRVGGRWHVLADGRVLHETPAGTWQPSVHTAEQLADPTRFTPATA